MEEQNSQHTQVIEINAEIPGGSRYVGRSKICGEAPCGFADAGSVSKDAKERRNAMSKLIVAVVLCAIFMSVEVFGGIKANSLAILTDAAHLLSDVAAFAISLFSLWAAGWEATPRQSYGFFRIEILGALLSIQLIWLLAGVLLYEAIQRLINDTGEVNGFLMFAVSAFGLLVNIVMAVLLGHDHGHSHGLTMSTHHQNQHHSPHDLEQDSGDQQHCRGHEDDHKHHHSHHSPHSPHSHQDPDHPLLDSSSIGGHEKEKRNINVHGAYLHVLGDCIQSIGVMIGGAVIWYKPEWKIVDLICTLIFSIVVLGTTINMLRSILEVLMESTPREIDARKLEKGLLEMEEVVAVHELHIWAITVGKVLLACHIKVSPEADADMVLDNVIDYIRRVHKISHVTIQVER